MRVAVFGTGAVGGYFGARLLRAGVEVSFVARGDQLRAIRKNGLRVEGASGDFTVVPRIATDRPQDIGEVDVVILGVKAWQVRQAAQQMKPLIGENTMVLPLQNGVEASQELAEVLGEEPVLVGLCQIAAQVVEPGVIRHMGIEPLVAFGALKGVRTTRLNALQNLFVGAGIKAQIPEDIQAALWDKFLFITAFGALGAITRAPAAAIRGIPQTRTVLLQVMEEIYRLATARGVKLDEQIINRRMAFIDSLPEETTASMARDVMSGRPSELEYLIGAVVRLAKESGTPTPVSDILYACLLPQEQQVRAASLSS